jgi:anti-sigma B factor antagonist
VVAADWAAMTESVDGHFTVRAMGEIDFANAQHFREYLLGAVSSADRSVRVDLRDVRYLDSSGLHALVAAHAAATRRPLRMDVDAAGLPRKVIEAAGLTYLLRESAEQAREPVPGADFDPTQWRTPEPLVTRVHDEGDVQVISVSGDADMEGGDAFSSALVAATRHGTRPVLLDLTYLQWINSRVASVIATAKHDASKLGLAFEIRNPNATVRRVLEICGVIDPPS